MLGLNYSRQYIKRDRKLLYTVCWSINITEKHRLKHRVEKLTKTVTVNRNKWLDWGTNTTYGDYHEYWRVIFGIKVKNTPHTTTTDSSPTVPNNICNDACGLCLQYASLLLAVQNTWCRTQQQKSHRTNSYLSDRVYTMRTCTHTYCSCNGLISIAFEHCTELTGTDFVVDQA